MKKLKLKTINFIKKVKLKKIGSLIYGLIISVLVIIALVVASSAFNIPSGIKFYTVQSGSMAPAISTGSLVVVKPFNDYKERDIITFKSEKDRNNQHPLYTVTHRIKEISPRENDIYYVTQGDANNSSDLDLTKKDLVLGRVILSIPLLGYPVSFAKTREGLIFLIVIPVTLIVYSELISIKNEALRLIAERKKRKLTLKEKIEEKVGEEIG
ncbi:MAG: signal peptidase I, partial [Patescibacteria group bacterium]|nr:signal peptidase I [Patescibacteria group bacterium]